MISNTLSTISLTFLVCLSPAANCQSKLSKDEIIDKYLKNGAWKYGLFSQEWQQKIDEGLKVDSTVAYLWQQKSMPLFKQMKYQEGMKALNRAVKFDPDKWTEYRGFMNCIFVKNYYAAIRDFELCKKNSPGRFVMDHSYDFYIAVSYIQLNQFKKAEELLDEEIRKDTQKSGADWVHYMTLFYSGIAKFEQNKLREAIIEFDKAIKQYSHFSDAKYYKGAALQKLGQVEEGTKVIKEAKADFETGYTINEDNALYERYPYQVNWKLLR